MHEAITWYSDFFSKSLDFRCTDLRTICPILQNSHLCREICSLLSFQSQILLCKKFRNVCGLRYGAACLNLKNGVAILEHNVWYADSGTQPKYKLIDQLWRSDWLQVSQNGPDLLYQWLFIECSVQRLLHLPTAYQPLSLLFCLILMDIFFPKFFSHLFQRQSIYLSPPHILSHTVLRYNNTYHLWTPTQM